MDLDQLRRRVTGPVLAPGDPGYDDERLGYQRADAHRPEVVLGATGPDDVVAAVRAAAESGRRLAVQATGHGLGATTDGVLVSTRRMDGVAVDPVRRVARVEAGVRGRALLAATAPHGLAPALGSSPSVGVVSYTLGGGVGLLARRHGRACDHVRALDVVTMDGRRRRVSAAREPELFRGLRGGGRHLGVVVAMEIDLHPLARFHGGSLFVDVAAVPDVVSRWRAWTDDLDDDVTSAVAVLPYPDVDGVPAPLRGRHVAQIQVVHLGEASRARRDLAPLRAMPTRGDTIDEQPVARLGSAFAEPEEPHAYRGRCLLVPDVCAADLDALVERAGPASGRTAVTGLRHLGGALDRPDTVLSTAGPGGAGFGVGVLTVLEPDRPDAAPGADDLVEAALAPFAATACGRSLNFTYGPLPADAVAAGFTAADAARLAALRAQVDPDGILLANHELPSRAVPQPPVRGGAKSWRESASHGPPR